MNRPGKNGFRVRGGAKKKGGKAEAAESEGEVRYLLPISVQSTKEQINETRTNTKRKSPKANRPSLRNAPQKQMRKKTRKLKLRLKSPREPLALRRLLLLVLMRERVLMKRRRSRRRNPVRPSRPRLRDLLADRRRLLVLMRKM